MRTLYHTIHKCKHSVYWTDPMYGIMAANYNCPWCGAGTGQHFVPLINYNATWDEKIHVGTIAAPNPDGTIGWPDPNNNDMRDPIKVQHMTGDVCCNYPPPPVQTMDTRRKA